MNAQDAVPEQKTIIEMGHPQHPTSIDGIYPFSITTK